MIEKISYQTSNHKLRQSIKAKVIPTKSPWTQWSQDPKISTLWTPFWDRHSLSNTFSYSHAQFIHSASLEFFKIETGLKLIRVLYIRASESLSHFLSCCWERLCFWKMRNTVDSVDGIINQTVQENVKAQKLRQGEGSKIKYIYTVMSADCICTRELEP